MAAAPAAAGSVTPAQLGFLAIFNPSLGNTDDTIDDQIVYYASVATQNSKRNKRNRTRPTDGIAQKERHERLRQIGLAQGMASFSRGFADGAAVDTIDTENSRVVLHELEPGWWILASTDFTKAPLPPRLPTKTGEGQEERFEYSSREMKSSGLLLADLLRAHNTFLLHHDSSLSALFVRSRRSKSIAVLTRYWDLFLSTWNVMLHGNPAREIFGGINIAASGELGFGVGEEDRGSGEREVLEGLVGRIDGLVDIVVSKFGDPEPLAEKETAGTDPSQWLGTGQEPGPEDGVIFLGTGALSRKSLRDVTHWMEDLYTWGDHAYGVIESPTSVRRARRPPPTEDPVPQEIGRASRRASKTVYTDASLDSIPEGTESKDIKTTEPRAGSKHSPGHAQKNASPKARSDQNKVENGGSMHKMASYLKMGYGTYWSIPGGGSGDAPPEAFKRMPQQNVAKQPATISNPPFKTPSRRSSAGVAGHFLIGLKGDIEEDLTGEGREEEDNSDPEYNSRTVLRTINVELESEHRSEATVINNFVHPASILTQSQVMGNMVPGYNSHDLNKAKKLRVVVYVNRPFIFALFFGLRTDSLAWDPLYRSLHHQLAPLKKPLLASTRYRPDRPNAGSSIHDLVWDPRSLTVHSTIPNIPETYEPQDSWSRADAISTHLHLLNIQASTRTSSTALERTQKTGRGWWIVWTRLHHARDDLSGSLSTIRESDADAQSRASGDGEPPTVGKEIFLIRRASDHVGFSGEAGSGEGAGRLMQGIGVDTRRYVEELLSLL